MRATSAIASSAARRARSASAPAMWISCSPAMARKRNLWPPDADPATRPGMLRLASEVLGEVHLEPARGEDLDAGAAGPEELPVGILAIIVGAKRDVPPIPQRCRDGHACGDG